MNYNWEETSITEPAQKGIIGMFGEGDSYYFFMNFMPMKDDQWENGSIQTRNFRVLFQMGGTLSDWEGVKYTHDVEQSETTVLLDQISCQNSIKTAGSAQIISDARDNSTFFGFMTFSSAAGDGTVDTTTVYIVRKIEEDEQTTEDQEIIRIENTRELKGTYYQKDGTGINFTVELLGAMSSQIAAGIALASSALLLTF